jgi:hypothetical protein
MAATRSSRLEPGSRALLLQTAADAIESQLERRATAGLVEVALPAELRELFARQLRDPDRSTAKVSRALLRG